jgi:hypothetical protein
MAIRSPFRSTNYSSGVQKRSGTGALYNKSKAAGLGVDSADSNLLKYSQGGTIRTVVSLDGTQTLTNKTLTSPVITGGVLTGAVLPIAASGGATRLLTLVNSGSVNLFDAATGIAYTLPANPTAGIFYDFAVTVLQTSGANVVIANAVPASTFLIGSVISFSGENVTPAVSVGPFIFNAPLASSFVKLTTNGTTLGGGQGSWFRFTCINTTTWFVEGVNHCPSGTLATPFSV